jgi:hypothetical protein
MNGYFIVATFVKLDEQLWKSHESDNTPKFTWTTGIYRLMYQISTAIGIKKG